MGCYNNQVCLYCGALELFLRFYNVQNRDYDEQEKYKTLCIERGQNHENLPKIFKKVEKIFYLPPLLYSVKSRCF